MEMCFQAASIWLLKSLTYYKAISSTVIRNWIYFLLEFSLTAWQRHELFCSNRPLSRKYIPFCTFICSKMSSQLPTKLEIDGDICQERKLVLALTRPNNAILYLNSDSHQEILWSMLSMLYVIMYTCLIDPFKTYIEYFTCSKNCSTLRWLGK